MKKVFLLVMRKFMTLMLSMILIVSSMVAFETKSYAAVNEGSINDMIYNRGYYPTSAYLEGVNKVLVAGGYRSSGVETAKTEFYDISTNIWAEGPSLNKQRGKLHDSMAILDDGRILVAGGSFDGGRRFSYELLNADYTEWTESSNRMNRAREGHSMVKLTKGNNAGKVLVIGGLGGNNTDDSTYLTSTEMYDPATDTWTLMASTNESRFCSAAVTLEDGRVLVVGGLESGPKNTCEIYDPDENKWTYAASIPDSTNGSGTSGEKFGMSLVLLEDGRVMLLGGVSGAANAKQADEETYYYYPEKNVWKQGPDLQEERSRGTTALLSDGRVLFAGGGNNATYYLNTASMVEFVPPTADNITVDTGTLVPAYDPDIYEYSISLGDEKNIGITVTDGDDIEVDGSSVVSSFKKTVDLSVSPENIYVDITDSDNLTARYTIEVTANEYDVIYNANGSTSGAVPSTVDYFVGNTVTVVDNTGNLVKDGYSFGGWNTQADGKGISYSANDTFEMGDANVTLFAVWVPETPELTVSGGVNSFTRGAAAVVVDSTLTVVSSESIAGAKVYITENFADGDTLSFDNQLGITGTYNGTTGVLSLNGTTTAANYQTALRSVKFSTTSANLTDRKIVYSIGENTFYYPETGHYYEYVDNGMNWTSARAAAEARTLYGMQGYLATITSAGENNFIGEKVTADAWIGASDSEQEGTWKWVTGPEAGTTLAYTNWASGQPDNNNNEDNALIRSQGKDWNDSKYDGHRYMVEYGGMPGDPTPKLAGTKTMQVTNEVPELTVSGGVNSFTRGAAAVVVDSTLTVVSSENIAGAKVYITENFADGDTLSFDNQLGITGTYNGTTGVLSLNGVNDGDKM